MPGILRVPDLRGDDLPAGEVENDIEAEEGPEDGGGQPCDVASPSAAAAHPTWNHNCTAWTTILTQGAQKNLESLRQRIGRNAVVQEGNQPHEDPNDLLRESFGVLHELQELIRKINATNAASRLPDGRTITEAIARRDELTQQHSLLQHAISSSVRDPDRYSMSEIKWVACIDVRTLQKQSDDIARHIRELNLLIQETNWKTDLG